jgi:hypothetical protein
MLAPNYLFHGIFRFIIQLSRINPIIDWPVTKAPIHTINILENNHINIVQSKLEIFKSNIPHLFYKHRYCPLKQHTFTLVFGFNFLLWLLLIKQNNTWIIWSFNVFWRYTFHTNLSCVFFSVKKAVINLLKHNH